MKKVGIIVGVLIIVGLVWYFASPQGAEVSSSANRTKASSASELPANGQGNVALEQQSGDEPLVGEEEDEYYDEYAYERPATELYASAEEALAAVEKGAVDYDDLVLEQFSDLGENCAWCDDFYISVRERMFAGDTTPDERSYYAEVLAVSARRDNIQTLVAAVQEASDPDDVDIYAESLELSILDDESIELLQPHMTSDNEILKEASIAAVTNQGTRRAVEVLYEDTRQKGDPDGYYSLGIGLGEVIPEEEAYPLLQDIMNQRNEYSHLAVKALLNGGVDGLKLVVDGLTASGDPETDRKLLENAIDHVSYEEEVEQYLSEVIKNSNNPVVVEFSKEVLEDFEVEEEFDDFGDEQEF